MSLEVYIGGVLITGAAKSIQLDSLSIDMRIGSRTTAQCIIQSLDNSYSPVAGEELKAYEGGSQIFGGLIQRPSISRATGTTLRKTTVTATDYRALADRRLTGERFGTSGYYGMKLYDIVRDLVTNCMGGDGVGLTYVPANTGPVIERFEADYQRVSDSFDQLCELAGDYAWNIDWDKEFLIYQPSTGSVVLIIDTATSNPMRDSLTVEETLESYANKIVVKFGQATADYSETFDGVSVDQPTDGVRVEWNVLHKVFAVPTITVNGTAKTVGIANVDTGKDWYWSQNSAQIQQDSGGTVLTSGDTLLIDYTGVDSIQTFSENAGEITARGTIENTAGIYESLYEVDTATSSADAQATADAIRSRLDEVSYRLNCEVRGLAGVQPGDRVTQNLTYLPTGNFVISNVRVWTIGKDIRRSIEAIKGPILQDGFQAFKQLTGSGSGSAISVSGGSGGSGSTASPWHTITYASTITPALTNGKNQRCTLTGPVTVAFPTGATDGEELRLVLIQDATGGRTATLNSGWKLDGSEVVTLPSTKSTIEVCFRSSSEVESVHFTTGIPA